MRKRLLSTIAAVAAGTGAAWGQSPGAGSAPLPPAPVGQLGGGGPMMMPPGAMAAPGAMPGPVGMPPGPGFDPGMGGPGYPMGVHGQPSWESPFSGGDVADVYNSRIAPRVWINGEYLLWFAQAQPTTYPLVTSGPPVSGGILGNTGTLIRHPRSDIGYDAISGFRISGGFFKDDARRYGWYASGLYTEDKTNRYTANSDATGQPVIARPFIDATTGAQASLLVAFPGFTSGGVTVDAQTQTFGAEIGRVANIYRSSPGEDGRWLWDVNMLYGFRFLEVDEDLTIRQTTNLLPGATVPFDGKVYGFPATLQVIDDFQVTNQFYGGQAGLMTTLARSRWSLGLAAKVALGVTHERVEAIGESRLASAPLGTNSLVPGGLFANASNIGRYNEDRFAVVPEATANLRYAWTSWLSTGVGYNFLYVSRVARPGNLFSPNVTPALIPTSPGYGVGPVAATPNPIGRQSDFWIQGVNFEIALRY